LKGRGFSRAASASWKIRASGPEIDARRVFNTRLLYFAVLSSLGKRFEARRNSNHPFTIFQVSDAV